MKKVFSILLAVIIIFTFSISFAGFEKPQMLDSDTAAADIVLDMVITRPIGLVGLIAGSVVYVVTLPVAMITKSVDRTQKALVKDPYDYTFVRPLGDIRGEENY